VCFCELSEQRNGKNWYQPTENLFSSANGQRCRVFINVNFKRELKRRCMQRTARWHGRRTKVGDWLFMFLLLASCVWRNKWSSEKRSKEFRDVTVLVIVTYCLSSYGSWHCGHGTLPCHPHLAPMRLKHGVCVSFLTLFKRSLCLRKESSQGNLNMVASIPSHNA